MRTRRAQGRRPCSKTESSSRSSALARRKGRTPRIPTATWSPTSCIKFSPSSSKRAVQGTWSRHFFAGPETSPWPRRGFTPTNTWSSRRSTPTSMATHWDSFTKCMNPTARFIARKNNSATWRSAGFWWSTSSGRSSTSRTWHPTGWTPRNASSTWGRGGDSGPSSGWTSSPLYIMMIYINLEGIFELQPNLWVYTPRIFWRIY